MEADQYLEQHKQNVPAWIQAYLAGQHTDRSELIRDFLASRIVYYPGSGTDGSPVALFNRSQSAHCFVYCDSGQSLEDVRTALVAKRFSGYEVAADIPLSKEALSAAGCVPPTGPGYLSGKPVSPYAHLVILKRTPNKDENHGSEAFAILFLGWDGFDAFEALFCNPAESTSPYCIVLQDHGFGGNTGRFGGGGRLEKLAASAGRTPQFILVGDNTSPWDNYAEPHEAGRSDEALNGWPGGMHGSERRLLLRHT